MHTPNELYHEEVKKLIDFRSQIESHSIYKEQLDEFSNDYEELIAQAKVITRVSDRLQKKLDSANLQIREQNDEIKSKNGDLSKTIEELAVARIGRKASTIMLTVALSLFILEQAFIQPFIEETFSFGYYVNFGILAGIFFLVKYLEGGLEEYFMKQAKRKIIAKQEKEGNMNVSREQ